jgi:hypothetical protein
MKSAADIACLTGWPSNQQISSPRIIIPSISVAHVPDSRLLMTDNVDAATTCGQMRAYSDHQYNELNERSM